MMTITELWKARLLLLGAAALYGTNFSLVKLLGENIPVGINSALRFGLASLVTFPWLVSGLFQFRIPPGSNISITNEKEEGSNSPQHAAAWKSLWLGLEVGLWNSIGYVSQAVGLETSPACESAFICSLAVVVVPLLDSLSGKTLANKQWIGAILAVIGVAFLELGDLDDSSSSSSSSTFMTSGSTGLLLSLIQPLSFGIGFWRMERAMSQFPDETRRMTAAQLVAVFIASIGYGYCVIGGGDVMITLQRFPWSEWRASPEIVFGVFWTGVVTTALTIYMENLAMKTLSAAETTLIFSTEPLWGTAFAALCMGEKLVLSEGIGAAFILFACIYSNLGTTGIQELLVVYGGKSSSPSSSKTSTNKDDDDNASSDDYSDEEEIISSSATDDAGATTTTTDSMVPTSKKRRVRFVTDGLLRAKSTTWLARRRHSQNSVLPTYLEETRKQQSCHERQQ